VALAQPQEIVSQQDPVLGLMMRHLRIFWHAPGEAQSVKPFPARLKEMRRGPDGGLADRVALPGPFCCRG